jgi:AbrB family looped-hinge helix DNA binding protein
MYAEDADNLRLQKCRQEHTMEATIQVRQRGTLTLPAELREKYGIRPGDTFRLVDLDGVLVLTPMVPIVPELAREIEQARLEAGLSIEGLLNNLREQREQY